MDKEVNMLEGIFEKWLKDLEEKPISTGIRIAILAFILKYIYDKLRKQS